MGICKKYVILAYSNDKTFDIPRQMVEIEGEPLLKRTIRLLRENGIEDITVTGKNESYKDLGVKLYSSKTNDFDYIKRTGYWLNAFDYELMDEPVCFIWGDVYFSEEAIKTIVETDTDSSMFFCSYNNKSEYYIKEHDEPFAYKVVDTDLFKEHIEKVKKMKDEGLCCREPIIWEVYRSIHNQDINTHEMTTDYVAINDITCDIDSACDVEKIKAKIRRKNNMIKVEAIDEFSLKDFDKIENVERANATKNKEGLLFIGDKFECDKDMLDYLIGNNTYNKAFVRIIEVIPEKKEIKIVEAPKEAKEIKKPKKTKLTKKK